MKKQISIADAKPGDKIMFAPWKRPYTVKARNERFLICTQPFNPQRTVFYTIIDLQRGERGTNNLVFNAYDYKTQEGIDECLKDLASGATEVTQRNCVDLDIITIYTITKRKYNGRRNTNQQAPHSAA